MKIFSNTHVFKFDWKSVTNVWWQKYPNMRNLSVECVDTVDRHIDEDSGALTMRRLVTASMDIPIWLKGMGFPSKGYVVEETTIDPSRQRMSIQSVNVSMDSLITIQETCTYSPEPSNPSQWTKYEQTAEITSVVPIVFSSVESWVHNTQQCNAIKGLSQMEEMCQRWATEGVEGFQSILNRRLDTILLMSKIDTLKTQLHALT